MTDQEIVTAILNRDSLVTEEFLYKKCYPLFNRLFAGYDTDCKECMEFIDEIYAFLLYPGKITHRSKLETFAYHCNLIGWIKTVCINYCNQIYSKKKSFSINSLDKYDITLPDEQSFEKTANNFNMADLSKILSSMESKRFATMIEYRYLKGYTNKEIAEIIGVPFNKYYHVLMDRARDQFTVELKKEGLI